MFCDLVTETPLAEQLDPDSLMQVVQRYHRLGAQVIHRFGGHIAQYLGDGLLVFFGYPQAYEDNALRAVNAGWELLRGLGELNPQLEAEFGVSLGARIGIHSGQIVVSQIGDARQQQQAFGRSMNLSARLQGLAAPNRIVISRDTLRLLGGSVRVRELGLHELKGIDVPIAAFEVIRPLKSHELPQQLDPTAQEQIIGRDRELAVLRQCWRDARAGRGRVVELVGEAGIGKSRLVRALRAELADEPHVYAHAQGSSYHRFSTFHPATELVAQTLGIDPAHPEGADLETIAAALEGTQLEGAAPVFARLLELPNSNADPRRSSDVERESMLEALTDWLSSFGGEHAALLVIEDLQFIDPSTLELLDRLIDRAQTERLLLITTSRPLARAPAARAPHVTTLELRPLSRQETESLLAARVGDRNLPTTLVETLVERTDGLPLFVEELTKMMLESNALQFGDATLAPSEVEFSIPTTLQDSLMARLDRLSDAKQVAQTAAVLGREFSRDVLEKLLTEPNPRIGRALDRLVKAEILEQRGDGPSSSFSFRHALIQEAAYHSLLRSTRQALHRRAAAVLREHAPQLETNAPELLAHHYDQGGQTEQAIEFWQRAGRRAIASSAILEAQGHLERALSLIRELPPGPERDRIELLPQAALVVALYTRRGYAASDVQQAVEHALSLSRSIEWNPITPFIQQLRITFLTTRGEYARARALVSELIEQASLEQDHAVVLRARAVLGQALLFQGDFRVAQSELEQAVRLREIEPLQNTALTRGVDTTLMSTGWLSWIYHFRGEHGASLAHSEQSLRQAEELLHPYSIAFSALQAGTLRQLRSETAAARAHAERALTLARKYRFGFCEAWGVALQGWIAITEGDLAGGSEQVTRGLELWDSLETTLARSIWLSLRGAAWAFGGERERGLEVIEMARAEAERCGERILLPELDRMAASVLLTQPPSESNPRAHDRDRERAEAWLARALDQARDQGSRWCELRCSNDLASLWGRQGDNPRAIELLEYALRDLDREHAPPEYARAERLLNRMR